MLIRIDPKSNTPVFEQIVQEIKSAIARSASVPDEMTPSVRQMATDILVNPNTVVSQGLSPSRARRRVIYASWAWRLCRGDSPPDACQMARRESVRQELRPADGHDANGSSERDRSDPGYYARRSSLPGSDIRQIRSTRTGTDRR